jgi:MoaA/NifB/PqqE/SkfB family radical SAM enzyme
MFICCNDYDFETIFGNVNEKPIKDIWMSLDHKLAIAKAYKTLCTTCSAAIWA